MIEELLEKSDSRMEASVRDTEGKLRTVRTGRASVNVLDGLRVDYYGTPTQISQLAKLSVPEPAMIMAQPFDTTIMDAIERAIMTSNLGLNPSNDGKVIRIPVPALTEERRMQMIRKVRKLAEDGKTAVRQIRRDANDEIKKLQKDKDSELSEDEAKRHLDQVQKLTDNRTKEIDELCKSKEAELAEV